MQFFKQAVYGHQHGAGHIVGINLIATHHQQCWPFGWRGGMFKQVLVCASQAIACRIAFFAGVVWLSAGTVQHAAHPALNHKTQGAFSWVKQVGGFQGQVDPLVAGIVCETKFITHPRVCWQWRVQGQVNQVNVKVLCHFQLTAMSA